MAKQRIKLWELSALSTLSLHNDINTFLEILIFLIYAFQSNYIELNKMKREKKKRV